MTVPLPGFASFLRSRRSDILADWNAALGDSAVPLDAASARRERAARWLDRLVDLADRPLPAAGAGSAAAELPRSAVATAVSDLSLLHRVIIRSAHIERLGWGLEEFELLADAFDATVAELIGGARPVSTERDSAEEVDNARLYDEAQRALRAREEILAIVTHDLRAPLSAVAAAASLLTSVDAESLDADRIRQRGDTIRRAARHMTRLVNDLMDLAQIDAGRLTVERVLDDPADVVREVREALDPVVTRRGGTLRVRTKSDLPRLALDRDRLRQVLANLVGNASKVGSTEITIAAETRGEEVVFSVADNGPGIPAEDLPRMFDRYWRGRGTQYRGAGLGLPISHGIVKAHGGRMWIESTPGKGSTFFFSVPR